MNKLLIYIVVVSFGGCVSQKEVEMKREELLTLQTENKRIKEEVKEFQVVQKKMRDTLETERKLFHDRVAFEKSNIPYLKFKADSMLIEKCVFASAVEKEVYHYLNFARTRPKEFCEKFVIPHWDKGNWYENTLVEKMMKMRPIGTLLPGKKLYESAECHARVNGKLGLRGHTRYKNPKTKQQCDEYFMGECISYGHETGLGVVLQLLIDDMVPSLGHRKICLSPDYHSVGISLQPHSGYGYNCVLDFM